MIRFVVGFGVCIGSVGGVELSSLSPIAGCLLGLLGLTLAYTPVRDGSLVRLINKKVG